MLMYVKRHVGQRSYPLPQYSHEGSQPNHEHEEHASGNDSSTDTVSRSGSQSSLLLTGAPRHSASSGSTSTSDWFQRPVRRLHFGARFSGVLQTNYGNNRKKKLQPKHNERDIWLGHPEQKKDRDSRLSEQSRIPVSAVTMLRTRDRERGRKRERGRRLHSESVLDVCERHNARASPDMRTHDSEHRVHVQENKRTRTQHGQGKNCHQHAPDIRQREHSKKSR